MEPASRPLPLLNVLGEQGWELVGFDPNDDGAYLLKRPAEFETEPTRPPRRIR